MPEVPVGYGQATIRIQLAGDLEPMSTGIGFGVPDVNSFTQVDADALAASLASPLKAIMQAGYQVTNVNLFVGLTIGDISLDSNVGNGPGTASGAPLPQNTSILVRKSGLLAGRKHRGRMYIPGVREANVNEVGLIDSTERTRIQGHVDALFDALENPVGGFNWLGAYILHSYGDATEPTAITAMQVDPVVATQRRRLRR